MSYEVIPATSSAARSKSPSTFCNQTRWRFLLMSRTASMSKSPSPSKSEICAERMPANVSRFKNFPWPSFRSQKDSYTSSAPICRLNETTMSDCPSPLISPTSMFAKPVIPEAISTAGPNRPRPSRFSYQVTESTDSRTRSISSSPSRSAPTSCRVS